MTATRRVYENDDLVRRILGFLMRTELKPIATLEKAFFPLVVGILWRAVNVRRLQCILDFPRSEYRKAIRYVDDDHIAGDLFNQSVSPLSEQEFASLRQRCPGLLGYSRDVVAVFHFPRWKIQCYPDGGGVIHHSYDTWVDVRNDFDPTSPPGPGPEPVWQGYQMICTAGIAFYGRRRWHDTPFLQKYLDWLLSGRMDPRVNRLRLHAFELDLDTVRRILEARTKVGEQPITELSTCSIVPFTADQFTMFGKQAGTDLERVELLHDADMRSDPLISTLDLSRVVDTITDSFPNLTIVLLHLAGRVGHHVPHDYVIPISTRPYDGKLRRVSILLHEEWIFEEYQGDVPLLAIARNLACLGGPGCHYEILLRQDEGDGSAFDMGDCSSDLRSLILYFKTRPPHIQRHLRTVNFKTDLRMTNPRLDDLHALTFTREGRPIPPIVVLMSKSYANHRLALHYAYESLVLRSRFLSLLSGTEGVPEDPYLNTDIVSWAWKMKFRKYVQDSQRKLERLAEEIRWPLVDPETTGSSLGVATDLPEVLGVGVAPLTE